MDPDDSEVLFNLALNHALMRQVRDSLKITNRFVLLDGPWESKGRNKDFCKVPVPISSSCAVDY